MIVVLGGRGYVGQAICQQLQQRGLTFQAWSRRDCDYSRPEVLLDFLRHSGARFLINSAGFTGRPNVDACELAKSECLAGNAVLPGTIREVCEHLQLPWGHVSSGCIYTGSGGSGAGFTEQDTPNFSFRQNNCSFYSGCKALGEEVLAGAERCYVWRLRIPFGHVDGPRNYISKLLRYDCLLDARNSISQLDECAAAFVDCWQRSVPYGVYNMTNPGSVTTRDVVAMIRRHGLSRKEFRFFDSDEQFLQIAAKTPRSNCVLDSGKAIAAGLQLRPVQEALEWSLCRWQAEGA
ncbi:MAG: sugar nucleotide-binding protein [Planctomyces sp.]|jgi:dTDP-4-dehydrorhamnose reductase